jgi:ribosomal protein S15P/S13E
MTLAHIRAFFVEQTVAVWHDQTRQLLCRKPWKFSKTSPSIVISVQWSECFYFQKGIISFENRWTTKSDLQRSFFSLKFASLKVVLRMFQLLRIPSKFSLRTLSTNAIETRFTHIPRTQELPETIAPVFSIDATDALQAFKAKKREHINKYQNHKLDVGSSQIQGVFLSLSLFTLPPSILTFTSFPTVAILTEKIRKLAAHLTENKKDKSAFRGFTV